MNDLAPNMTDLKGKIEQLVKLHQQMKQENDRLKLDNQELVQKMEEQQKQIVALEAGRSELIQSKEKEQETIITDTKSKINELVQEIDNCIALLNN